ncbi:MAG: hypothetical protein GX660_02110 [Clostridiaceae bacterium]|nr:hypothetical protein [Clostridiaceae bacterium]
MQRNKKNDVIIAEKERINHLKCKFNIPEDIKPVAYTFGFPGLPYCDMYVWVDNDCIKFLPDVQDAELIKILNEDFDGYSKHGRVVRELDHKISQSNNMLQRAILAILAFISKQPFEDEVYSVEDQRMTALEAKYDGSNVILFFESHDLYNRLLIEMPNKELL